jgi:hypothetical protein
MRSIRAIIFLAVSIMVLTGFQRGYSIPESSHEYLLIPKGIVEWRK